MSSAKTNEAAWMAEPGARMIVKEAPYTQPEATEVVIEVGAVATNPIDYKVQDLGSKFPAPISYPTIIGSDCAGTIVAIGSDVRDYKVGDRVMSHCFGFMVAKPGGSAFQRYVVSSIKDIVRIPEHVSFKEAAVLPLSCDTAMAGLYLDEFLGLQFPERNARHTGETLLVWGGSSSVGCSVIQMARASGYDVLAVASKRNHALCSELGATMTIDYADANVVDAAVSALHGRKLAGAFDCIGDAEKSVIPTAQILAQTEGSKKLMASLHPPSTGLPDGINAQRVMIPKLVGTPVPGAIRAWMAEALVDKQLRPMPNAQVVGHGLEHVQEAIDQLRKGVSAIKLVVTL